MAPESSPPTVRALDVRGARGAIRILPPELIARIAAGEVVERPASVVKELVENALDAGARRIRVQLTDGGVSEILVHDDGTGLPPSQLALAVQPHATSKLFDASSLQTLSTLGFRGEALPSIASVSRFTMTSRTRAEAHEAHGDNAGAWRIEVNGGQPQEPQARPAAGPVGTTVLVRELFYNLPARKKFLKGLSSEAAAAADTLQRLALTRPDVAFTLQHGRSTLLELPAVQSKPANRQHPRSAHAAPDLPIEAYHQRARELLGRTNSKGLLEIDLFNQPASDHNSDHNSENGASRLYGLLSPPSLTRPNRNLIYLTVNGRSVKDRTLTSALLEACRHLLPPRRYPIAVLFLELDGNDVDINVHPAKTEVRFRQPGSIYALLHQAVRQAFDLRDPLRPTAVDSGRWTVDGERWTVDGKTRVPSTLSFPRTGALLAETQPQISPVTLSPLHPFTPSSSQPDRASESPAPYNIIAAAVLTPSPLHPFTPSSPAHVTDDFRVIGQAAASYIVLEDETGVRLIDQHALHERILFEGLLASSMAHARADAQSLLIPEPVELSPAQAALLSASDQPLELLSELGFDCEPFGPRTLLVRAIPTILRQASPAGTVSDFLESLAAGDDSPPSGWAGSSNASNANGRAQRRFSLREKAAYIVSCKAALKAGERLTVDQMRALILEFRRVAGPLAERGNLTCPHGRKLSLDVSWHDLERAVGRA